MCCHRTTNPALCQARPHCGGSTQHFAGESGTAAALHVLSPDPKRLATPSRLGRAPIWAERLNDTVVCLAGSPPLDRQGREAGTPLGVGARFFPSTIGDCRIASSIKKASMRYTKLFTALGFLLSIGLASCSGGQSVIPGSLRSGTPTLSTHAGVHTMSAPAAPLPAGNGTCAVFDKNNPACTIANTTTTPAPSEQPCGACSGNTGNPFGYGGPKPVPSLPPCVQTNSCVAMRNPTKSAVCYGSQMELGDQYPGNTTDYNHEIVNIYPVFANNQISTPQVAAWEYVMGSGSVYSR